MYSNEVRWMGEAHAVKSYRGQQGASTKVNSSWEGRIQDFTLLSSVLDLKFFKDGVHLPLYYRKSCFSPIDN